MSLLKSLAERARAKREELQRRAAKKVAKVALDATARVARGAADFIGEALEQAMFGVTSKPDEIEEAQVPTAQPDPFARVKAAEAERANVDRAKRKSDAELAAHQKKLGE